jgi:hypothetical protein
MRTKLKEGALIGHFRTVNDLIQALGQAGTQLSAFRLFDVSANEGFGTDA